MTMRRYPEEWVKEVKCVGVTAGASARIFWCKMWWHVCSSWAVVKPFRWKAVKKTLFFEVPKELRVDIREVD
ncbi:hypothetical protein ACP0HM_29030 [Escherichia coli]